MDTELKREAVRFTALSAASEDWSAEYAKAPDQHAKLIKTEAKWQVALTKLFGQFAQHVPKYLNGKSYNSQSRLDDQEPRHQAGAIIKNMPDDQWSDQFIDVSLALVGLLTVTGARAGRVIYDVPLEVSSIEQAIQELSTEQVANLVGRRVLSDGSIVDNPNPKINITETIREDIAQSIKTSLAEGETLGEATRRVQRVIANPYRAALIARTESVNAYQAGLLYFGAQSGAVGKQWRDAGAVDICADNTAEGPIRLEATFVSGAARPPQHPNCRCGIRLIYAREWTDMGRPLA